MALWDRDDFVDARAAASGAGAPGGRRWLAQGGMVLSAALMAGLVFWGYRLAVRQMHGIPAIHAPEGPARVAPDNPGGELADHQGLAVNMIAAVGEAERTADLLVLAPRPAELSDTDAASGALRIVTASTLAPPPPAAAPGPNVGTVQPSATLRAMQPSQGQLAEPLEEGLADRQSIPDVEMIEAGAIEAALIEAGVAPAPAETLVILSVDVPGVTQSPRPLPRPGPAAEPAALAQTPAQAREIDPALLAPGTALVQIGSFDTVADARLGWDATASRFPGIFAGKARVVQAADSGGTTFYRLRVEGFADRDDARRFCAAVSGAVQCVPVMVK